MSCFVMKAQSIANLAAYIARVLDETDFSIALPETGLHEFADCTFPDETTLFDEVKIYAKLYEFNLESYRERYEHDPDPDEAPVILPVYNPSLTNLPKRKWIAGNQWRRGYWQVTPDHYALLKSFECYLYQTAEGKCLDSDFRKELKFLRDDLQSFIIFNSPQFINAPWG